MGAATLRGDVYGGEPSANTVADAIRNQGEYERREDAMRAEEAAKAAAKRREAIEARAAKEREAAQLNAIREQRQAVHTEITKYFSVVAVSHETQPTFNSAGYEIQRHWVLHLRLKNHSPREVIGVAGYLTINDAFGNELGVFTIKIEPKVPSGKEILFDVSMPLNRRDPSHVALMQAQTLFPVWFMESIAYIDGSRIDAQTLGRSAPQLKNDANWNRGKTS